MIKKYREADSLKLALWGTEAPRFFCPAWFWDEYLGFKSATIESETWGYRKEEIKNSAHSALLSHVKVQFYEVRVWSRCTIEKYPNLTNLTISNHVKETKYRSKCLKNISEQIWMAASSSPRVCSKQRLFQILLA